MLATFAALAVLLLQPAWASGTELKLGFLFTQSSESWLQESWALFKLAIRDVNADANLLPNHTLTYIPFDAQANGPVALAGTGFLAANGVVGIVGTGYSNILQPVAVRCSALAMPVVSPTSTGVELLSKADYPFLFRTQPNDESMLKIMVVIIKELMWYVVAVLHNSRHTAAVGEILGPALEAARIAYTPLSYMTPDTQMNQMVLGRVLAVIKAKGFGIIALHAEAADMPFMWGVANQVGLVGNGHCWVMTEQAFVPPWNGNAVDVLVARRLDTDVMGLGSNFRTRWPSAATRYDQATHGPFDPVTKLPFYNLTDATIWDTGSGTAGDGVPEPTSMSTYDSVFVLAKALQAVVDSGGSPTDGARVRTALLATQHMGITGMIQFSPFTQDRGVPVEVVLAQGPAAPHVVGQGTAALGIPVNPIWCDAGCLSATPQQLMALPWSQGPGAKPKDGTHISLTYTKAYWIIKPRVDGQDNLDVGIALRDSFGQVACKLTCVAHGPTSVPCGMCMAEFSTNHFEMEFYPYNFTGPRLQTLSPRGIYFDESVMSFMMWYPIVDGGGPNDRVLSIKVTYKGQVIEDGIAVVPMISRGCTAGHHGPDSNGFPPCYQCVPGRITITRGAVNCTLCGLGTHVMQAARSQCESCAAGRYAGSRGLSECVRCEQGKFQPARGASSCVPCPPPMTTKQVGLTDVSSCVCPSGFYRPRGSLLVEGLPRGPCEPCPVGMSCPLGSDANNFPAFASNATTASVHPQLLANYWSSPDAPLSIFECGPGAFQCPGGPPGSCAFQATGRVCALCQEGYYFHRGEDGGCIRCPSEHLSRFLFPTLMILFSIFTIGPIYYVHKDYGITSWNSAKMVTGQVVTLMLTYLQVAAITRTLNLELPLPKTDLIIMAVRPFGLLQMECSGVRTFAQSVAMNLITPAWCGAMIGCVGVISYVLSKVLKRPFLNIDVLICCLGGAFTAYFTLVCSISLSVFKCYQHPNGERSIISAPQVLCNTDEWYNVAGPAIVAVLVYCGGSLAVFIYGLWCSRTARIRNDSFRQRWKFMLVKFRPVSDWWFLLVLIKSVLLNMVQVIFDNGHDQLFFVTFIILSYALATMSRLPWRHATCNRVDVAVHLLLTFFCSILYWYARVEQDGDVWRKFFIAYGLWIPFILEVIYLCYRVGKHFVRSRVDRKSGASRSTVAKHAPDKFQMAFMAFALMPEEELLDLLKGMAPMDRRMLEKTDHILKTQLEVASLQACMSQGKYAEVRRTAAEDYENMRLTSQESNVEGGPPGLRAQNFLGKSVGEWHRVAV